MSEFRSDELEKVLSCPVCGGIQSRDVYTELKDEEEGVAGTWSVAKCDHCESLFLSPRPRESVLAKAYRTYYTHEPTLGENRVLSGFGWSSRVVLPYLSSKYGVPASKPSAFFRWVVACAWPLRLKLDYYMRHLPATPGRLLDVGCGSGGFLTRCVISGWDAVGIEPDPVAARVARETSGVAVHHSIDVVEPESFDRVTLSHVIEHVHSPLSLLKDCHRVLARQGEVWIATPNVSSMGLRLFGQAWQPLEVPRHLVMPSPNGMKALLRQAGFEDISFLRRGSGSYKRLRASSRRARSQGAIAWPALALAPIIDMAASFSALAGEEIVVRARKG